MVATKPRVEPCSVPCTMNDCAFMPRVSTLSIDTLAAGATRHVAHDAPVSAEYTTSRVAARTLASTISAPWLATSGTYMPRCARRHDAPPSRDTNVCSSDSRGPYAASSGMHGPTAPSATHKPTVSPGAYAPGKPSPLSCRCSAHGRASSAPAPPLGHRWRASSGTGSASQRAPPSNEMRVRRHASSSSSPPSSSLAHWLMSTMLASSPGSSTSGRPQ
mmetsp:Transcript_51575/g.126607  ORF Transcript_51575/g.126607 Transcript_51575/m.126607 type:complete len:218 (+) Transcript_51575:138-791(+)